MRTRRLRRAPAGAGKCRRCIRVALVQDGVYLAWVLGGPKGRSPWGAGIRANAWRGACGRAVVRPGELQSGARPGRAVRRSATTAFDVCFNSEVL